MLLSSVHSKNMLIRMTNLGNLYFLWKICPQKSTGAQHFSGLKKNIKNDPANSRREKGPRIQKGPLA